jgi:hypothetical protein
MATSAAIDVFGGLEGIDGDLGETLNPHRDSPVVHHERKKYWAKAVTHRWNPK